MLSTRSGVEDEPALLALADALEQAGFTLSGWQADGPGVRVTLHGPADTISASLGELQTAAAHLRAGRPEAWRSLVLQDGTAPGHRGPHLPETLS